MPKPQEAWLCDQKDLPLVEIIERIKAAGFEIRTIGAGKWVVHVPDQLTSYAPRSYFDRDQLLELAKQEMQVDLAFAIYEAHQPNRAGRYNQYIQLKGETMLAKQTKQSKKAKATKKAAAKKVAAAGNGKVTKARVTKVSNDPDVQYLATFQDKTIERMSAKAVLNIYRKIKKATKAKPVVHAGLSAYDKRLSRELARLGIVSKEALPDVGLAYFGAQ